MKVGDIHNSSLLITEKDEQIFMDLTGDVNPIHWDADVAKKEGYSSPIVHGMLAAAMIGKEIGMYFPGKGTINMERSFQFIRPLIVKNSTHFITTINTVTVYIISQII